MYVRLCEATIMAVMRIRFRLAAAFQEGGLLRFQRGDLRLPLPWQRGCVGICGRRLVLWGGAGRRPLVSGQPSSVERLRARLPSPPRRAAADPLGHRLSSSTQY